jgi:hypothetical protein
MPIADCGGLFFGSAWRLYVDGRRQPPAGSENFFSETSP